MRAGEWGAATVAPLGPEDDYEERQYEMRRPLMARSEHRRIVAEKDVRIAELERALATAEAVIREQDRLKRTRRIGW